MEQVAHAVRGRLQDHLGAGGEQGVDRRARVAAGHGDVAREGEGRVVGGNQIHFAILVHIQRDDGVTPTPVISRAILIHNRGRKDRLADGIVITPSHNPPEDGGYKYNPPHGGPADTDVTGKVEKAANAYLAAEMNGVKRIPYARARKAPTTACSGRRRICSSGFWRKSRVHKRSAMHLHRFWKRLWCISLRSCTLQAAFES